MKYQLTLLNMLGFGALFISLIYSIVNANTLMSGEGWGLVGMIGIMGLSSMGIAVDYLIQKATATHDEKNRGLKRNLYG